MLTKNSKFVIGLAIQVLIILGIVIFKLAILQGGTAVALRLAPVDPRDMFRGDYMTIRYDISSIPSSYFTYNPVRDGDIVYVPLIQSGSVWSADYGVSKKLPAETNGKVYIKGAVINGGQEATPFSGNSFNSWRSASVSIGYNIEQYYVPEGLGNTWVSRSDASDSNTFASVMVGDNGEPVLKKLYLKGKPWPK